VDLVLVGVLAATVGSVAVIAGVVGWWAFRTSRGARARRAAEKAMPATIANAPHDALVIIEAKVGSAEPLMAPVSGATCSFYELVLEVQHGLTYDLDGPDRTLRTLIHEREPFEMKITSFEGDAIVETGSLVLNVPPRKTAADPEKLTPRMRELLAKNEIGVEVLAEGAKRSGTFGTWQETMLLPGTKLRITGVANRHDGELTIVTPAGGAVIIDVIDG
jgi:hypothetical protein